MHINLHGRAGEVYREIAWYARHRSHVHVSARLIATNLDMPVSTVRYNLKSLQARGLIESYDTSTRRNFGFKKGWRIT